MRHPRTILPRTRWSSGFGQPGRFPYGGDGLAAILTTYRRTMVTERPLLIHAAIGDERKRTTTPEQEEKHERAADRPYGLPLRAERERLRHQKSEG